MLEGLLEAIAALTINLISSLGYFGIFLAMAIESASIPLPSEIIMPFSGYLVSTGKFNFYLVVLVGAAGNLFGSIVMYVIGSWGKERFVRTILRSWARILIDEKKFELGEKWFRRYGDFIVFASRIFPVVRTFISLPAGVVKVNFYRFCLYTFAGSLIWSAFLTFIGVKLGENWSILEPIFRRFDTAILIIAVMILIIYFFFKYKKLIKAKKHKSS